MRLLPSSSGDRRRPGSAPSPAQDAAGSRSAQQRPDGTGQGALTIHRDDAARADPGDLSGSPAREPSSAADWWLAVGAAVTALLALVVLAGLPPAGSTAGSAVRGLLLLAFWLLGPGSAVVVHVRLPALTKVAVAPLLGIGALVVTSLIGTWVGPGAPRLSAALVAVIVLVAVGAPLLRRSVRRSPLPPAR